MKNIMDDSAEKKLMISVLATQVKDYFQGIRFDRRDIRGRAAVAENYIKNTSMDYIFSFDMICHVIGLDPIRLRRRILEIRTMEEYQAVLDKIHEKGIRNEQPKLDP